MTGTDARAPGDAAGLSPRQWADALGALVVDLRSRYERLEAMGDRQTALIRAEDMDGLIAHLRERQRVIDGITRAAEAMGPLVRRWDELSETVEGDRRESLRASIRAIDELARRVAARDDEHRAVLEHHRDEVADRLAGVGRGQAAVSAYGAGARFRPARFQDRQA